MPAAFLVFPWSFPPMISGVWPAAPGNVESVGHDGTVLAFPVASPLQAVSFEYASPVDVYGVTVSSPLLQSSLSLGLRGAPASEAGLGVCQMLDEVLAEPVSDRALLAWEVGRPIGS